MRAEIYPEAEPYSVGTRISKRRQGSTPGSPKTVINSVLKLKSASSGRKSKEELNAEKDRKLQSLAKSLSGRSRIGVGVIHTAPPTPKSITNEFLTQMRRNYEEHREAEEVLARATISESTNISESEGVPPTRRKISEYEDMMRKGALKWGKLNRQASEAYDQDYVGLFGWDPKLVFSEEMFDWDPTGKVPVSIWLLFARSLYPVCLGALSRLSRDRKLAAISDEGKEKEPFAGSPLNTPEWKKARAMISELDRNFGPSDSEVDQFVVLVEAAQERLKTLYESTVLPASVKLGRWQISQHYFHMGVESIPGGDDPKDASKGAYLNHMSQRVCDDWKEAVQIERSIAAGVNHRKLKYVVEASNCAKLQEQVNRLYFDNPWLVINDSGYQSVTSTNKFYPQVDISGIESMDPDDPDQVNEWYDTFSEWKLTLSEKLSKTGYAILKGNAVKNLHIPSDAKSDFSWHFRCLVSELQAVDMCTEVLTESLKLVVFPDGIPVIKEVQIRKTETSKERAEGQKRKASGKERKRERTKRQRTGPAELQQDEIGGLFGNVLGAVKKGSFAVSGYLLDKISCVSAAMGPKVGIPESNFVEKSDRVLRSAKLSVSKVKSKTKSEKQLLEAEVKKLVKSEMIDRMSDIVEEFKSKSGNLLKPLIKPELLCSKNNPLLKEGEATLVVPREHRGSLTALANYAVQLQCDTVRDHLNDKDRGILTALAFLNGSQDVSRESGSETPISAAKNLEIMYASCKYNLRENREIHFENAMKNLKVEKRRVKTIMEIESKGLDYSKLGDEAKLVVDVSTVTLSDVAFKMASCETVPDLLSTLTERGEVFKYLEYGVEEITRGIIESAGEGEEYPESKSESIGARGKKKTGGTQRSAFKDSDDIVTVRGRRGVNTIGSNVTSDEFRRFQNMWSKNYPKPGATPAVGPTTGVDSGEGIGIHLVPHSPDVSDIDDDDDGDGDDNAGGGTGDDDISRWVTSMGGNVPAAIPADVPADISAGGGSDDDDDFRERWLASYRASGGGTVPDDELDYNWADVPVDVPDDVPVDVPDDVPDDIPDDVPADEPVDEPVDVPVDEPVDEPAHQPFNLKPELDAIEKKLGRGFWHELRKESAIWLWPCLKDSVTMTLSHVYNTSYGMGEAYKMEREHLEREAKAAKETKSERDTVVPPEEEPREQPEQTPTDEKQSPPVPEKVEKMVEEIKPVLEEAEDVLDLSPDQPPTGYCRYTEDQTDAMVKANNLLDPKIGSKEGVNQGLLRTVERATLDQKRYDVTSPFPGDAKVTDRWDYLISDPNVESALKDRLVSEIESSAKALYRSTTRITNTKLRPNWESAIPIEKILAETASVAETEQLSGVQSMAERLLGAKKLLENGKLKTFSVYNRVAEAVGAQYDPNLPVAIGRERSACESESRYRANVRFEIQQRRQNRERERAQKQREPTPKEERIPETSPPPSQPIPEVRPVEIPRTVPPQQPPNNVSGSGGEEPSNTKTYSEEASERARNSNNLPRFSYIHPDYSLIHANLKAVKSGLPPVYGEELPNAWEIHSQAVIKRFRATSSMQALMFVVPRGFVFAGMWISNWFREEQVAHDPNLWDPTFYGLLYLAGAASVASGLFLRWAHNRYTRRYGGREPPHWIWDKAFTFLENGSAVGLALNAYMAYEGIITILKALSWATGTSWNIMLGVMAVMSTSWVWIPLLTLLLLGVSAGLVNNFYRGVSVPTWGSGSGNSKGPGFLTGMLFTIFNLVQTACIPVLISLVTVTHGFLISGSEHLQSDKLRSWWNNTGPNPVQTYMNAEFDRNVEAGTNAGIAGLKSVGRNVAEGAAEAGYSVLNTTTTVATDLGSAAYGKASGLVSDTASWFNSTWPWIPESVRNAYPEKFGTQQGPNITAGAQNVANSTIPTDTFENEYLRMESNRWAAGNGTSPFSNTSSGTTNFSATSDPHSETIENLRGLESYNSSLSLASSFVGIAFYLKFCTATNAYGENSLYTLPKIFGELIQAPWTLGGHETIPGDESAFMLEFYGRIGRNYAEDLRKAVRYAETTKRNDRNNKTARTNFRPSYYLQSEDPWGSHLGDNGNYVSNEYGYPSSDPDEKAIKDKLDSNRVVREGAYGIDLDVYEVKLKDIDIFRAMDASSPEHSRLAEYMDDLAKDYEHYSEQRRKVCSFLIKLREVYAFFVSPKYRMDTKSAQILSHWWGQAYKMFLNRHDVGDDGLKELIEKEKKSVIDIAKRNEAIEAENDKIRQKNIEIDSNNEQKQKRFDDAWAEYQENLRARRAPQAPTLQSKQKLRELEKVPTKALNIINEDIYFIVMNQVSAAIMMYIVIDKLSTSGEKVKGVDRGKPFERLQESLVDHSWDHDDLGAREVKLASRAALEASELGKGTLELELYANSVSEAIVREHGWKQFQALVSVLAAVGNIYKLYPGSNVATTLLVLGIGHSAWSTVKWIKGER